MTEKRSRSGGESRRVPVRQVRQKVEGRQLAGVLTSAKWLKLKANLKEGKVVRIKDKNPQRCNWKLARVKVPVTGVDGRVHRVVVTRIGG